MEVISNLLSAFGLSGAAGLNAYVPLLLMGLLDRLNVVHLQDPVAWLSNPWVLLIVAVLGALDFVGDKVPGVDHALHLVGGVVNAGAGALLFASQNHLVDVPPALSMVLGFMVAGGVQATRTAVRPVATATTGGLANPVVSFLEDVSSLLVSVLAVFVPVLGVLLLVALVWWASRWWARRRRRKLA
ncbi:DUF4126 domain-containing protein [Deinococcus maricopensis]|uniref:DUF4126 domain-containing protein n=1 Tax=Deinococcus maricopensis (strain DSM 21211 / LMG 22137 / NRRL B-23946 / LB-34) TaxID=709986 RepID=E8UBF6_DEIML|nr:DUF4126 domain-containing protein [Deinococcus maricopensis]ADV68395.1 hypothetical protein Deima_2766 [Deinococcus maricopensis DSM 21211]